MVGVGLTFGLLWTLLSGGLVWKKWASRELETNVARKRADWVPASVDWTESADDVLKSDADIVIELIGGLKPAYDWARGALLAGKSVVTANKQLIAHHGSELLDLARSRGLEVRFEASVAGGVPATRGTRIMIPRKKQVQI